jgi:diacylglycerol kinase family enzyme
MPSGTGGDFRRTLKTPARAASAAAALRAGRTRLIDAGRVTFVNHSGESESRYFIGVASFGMSGRVIERAKNEERKPRGADLISARFTYALAALQTAFAGENTKVKVSVDDGPERLLTIANLCVANARYFGGGMKVAPEARLDDGLFDLVIIGDLSAAEIFANSPRLYLGKHLSMKRVACVRAARLAARPAKSGESILLEVDGELPGRLPATFEILPQRLRVRCP